MKKKQKEEKGKNFLLQYFLQTYLYSGNEEVLKKAGEILDESNWEQWHCAILIESDKAFFDNVPDNIDDTGFPSDGEDFRRHFPQRCGAAEEAF